MAHLIASPKFRSTAVKYIWPLGTAGSRHITRSQEILFQTPVNGPHADWDEYLVLEDGTQLRPQKVYQDPEGRGDRCLVLCDAIDEFGYPIPSNKRHAAILILNQPGVAAAEPCFKIRQDYIFLRHGCSGNEGPRTWDFKNAIPDRAVVDSVMQEILEGRAHTGSFTGGITVADDVWILRYIVEKVATKYGLVAFDPNMIPGYDIEAAIRLEFSTRSMRNARGYEAAKLAVHKLKMRDALSGEGNSEYKILPIIADGNEKPSEYVIDVKMPPSHEMDPYKITSRIAETVLLWNPTVHETLVAGSHTIPFLRIISLDYGEVDWELAIAVLMNDELKLRLSIVGSSEIWSLSSP